MIYKPVSILPLATICMSVKLSGIKEERYHIIPAEKEMCIIVRPSVTH